MTTLQANFAALVEAHSGAPALTNASMPSAIAQNVFATTTASGSTTGSSYTLTGGTYSWWTASGSYGDSLQGFAGGDTAAGVIGITAIGTLYVDERYVQASPPYNLGNGDVPLFVFLLLKSDDSIRHIRVMPDPPWAYHGPTDIRAQRIDAVSARAWRMHNGEEIELTPEFKNSDMGLIPHPFINQMAPGDKVALLEPTGKLIDRLHGILLESHAKEVFNLFHRDHILLSSPDKQFLVPPGVIGVCGRVK